MKTGIKLISGCLLFSMLCSCMTYEEKGDAYYRTGAFEHATYWYGAALGQTTGESKARIQGKYNYARQAAYNNIKQRAMTNMSSRRIYAALRDFNQAKKYGQDSELLSQEQSAISMKTQAETILNTAKGLEASGRFNEAIASYNSIAQYSTDMPVNIPAKIQHCQNLINYTTAMTKAKAEYTSGNYEVALSLFTQAQQYYNSVEVNNYITDINRKVAEKQYNMYLAAAQNAETTGDYQTAMNHYLAAIQCCASANIASDIAQAGYNRLKYTVFRQKYDEYMNQARAYEAANNWESACQYYKYAWDTSASANISDYEARTGYYRCRGGTGVVVIDYNGRLSRADYYWRNHDYYNAWLIYDEIYRHRPHLVNVNRYREAKYRYYYNKGLYEMNRKNYKSALEHFNHAHASGYNRGYTSSKLTFVRNELQKIERSRHHHKPTPRIVVPSRPHVPVIVRPKPTPPRRHAINYKCPRCRRDLGSSKPYKCPYCHSKLK